ncbi:MAG TPA: acyltransferase [Pseudolysinimonas sp.]|jgi:fucose 4-O-acetylase-like acetyltransferase|nr:acyltransferase [Pseudolysinimonas sp.]
MADAEGRATSSAPDLSKRDLTLDLARVFCVLLVVVIHLLMVGVDTNAPGGGLALVRPLEAQPWFPLATWFGQIMPLFFVVGGFASMTAWRSLQRRGGGAEEYVRSRILRLVQPTFPLFVFYSVVISAGLVIVATTGALGFEVLDGVFIGAGSPLWFIAAYAICQSLVPVLARLHAAAPKRTLLVLLLGVIVVDVIRYSTADLGLTSYWLGLINLLFVWPLVQQIGFWYADGFFDRPLWQLAVIALIALGMLWPLTAFGPYDVNMLVNLNPPTLPLVFLGVAQAAVLRMLRRPLSALMRTRVMRGIVFAVGTRLMTVYLWHLPVIIALAGVALLIPGASPAPASEAWWITRPIGFVLVLALLFALSLIVGRWEQPREPGSIPPAPVVAIAAVLTIAVPVLLIPLGLDLALAIAGAVTFGVAILILGRWPRMRRLVG